MRTNVIYGAATAVTGIISSALLAWCIPQLLESPGRLFASLDASEAWMFWQLDILLILASTVAALFRVRKPDAVFEFLSWQVKPAIFIMGMSCFGHFLFISHYMGFIGGTAKSLVVALLFTQMTGLLDNLNYMNLRPSPAAQ